jgi:hypothetical protein
MINVRFTRNTAPTGEALSRALQGSPLNGLVNWTGAPLEGALNAKAKTHKFEQLETLQAADVRCPYHEKPLANWPTLPPYPGWIPRTNFHRAGRDFVRRNVAPDFWVKPLVLSEEWRVHVFKTKKGNYRVVRCAKKVPLEGAHPWIRNYDLGWRFSYEMGCPEEIKTIAREAIKALDLDFGAVDAGMDVNNAFAFVLEVNTCPALEDATLGKYVSNIIERLS